MSQLYRWSKDIFIFSTRHSFLFLIDSFPISSNGKIIYAKNLELFTANLKSINTGDKDLVSEGENIAGINNKDLGTADFYPTVLATFIKLI